MPGDKRSRKRWQLRPDNPIASGGASHRLEGTSSSSGNDVPPRSSSTPLPIDRPTSGSSIKSNRTYTKNVSDHSENEIEREVSACAKHESSSSKDKTESPVDAVRKVEEYLMSDYTRSIENREIASSDNHLAGREKRRKSRRERKENSRLIQKESNRTEDEDAYDEEVPSSERDLSRPKSRKDRVVASRKSRRRKRSRARRDSSAKAESEEREEKEENELPITEILRKAQENTKTRCEEPVPLTELKTDKIYVQGRNGFSVVRITGDQTTGFFGRRKSKSREPSLYPIKVAIFAQKVWNGTGLIYQGLLAGMALMHFLLVGSREIVLAGNGRLAFYTLFVFQIQTFFKLSLDVLVKYSRISELYTNIFSFLVTMCVVSAFDKFDVAHVNLEHLREIYAEHYRSFMALPLYVATFCLHQTSLLVDDRISLLHYGVNATEFENNSTGIIVEEDLVTWQRVTLAKDGLAVFAWLFVTLGPREDMLLTHLTFMEKYADITNVSK